jgi:hypothetical protein
MSYEDLDQEDRVDLTRPTLFLMPTFDEEVGGYVYFLMCKHPDSEDSHLASNVGINKSGQQVAVIMDSREVES